MTDAMSIRYVTEKIQKVGATFTFLEVYSSVVFNAFVQRQGPDAGDQILCLDLQLKSHQHTHVQS